MGKMAKRNKAFPEKVIASRRRTLLREYGLTVESFSEMLANQSGRCGICKVLFSKKKRINVDHCHDTKVVRGLLCTGCNVSLGHIERKGFLEKANKYLSRI